MEMKMLGKRQQTMIRILGCFLTGVLASAVAAQPAASGRPRPELIDPNSIDLTQPTLFIVPYSHLDDMWRWSYPQTIRDFLRNTLADNFAAFEVYPHFVFNGSGASRYAMMPEYYPERYEELKRWIAAGRWFPSGSSWVENDTIVPSTESIIRQILMGRTYCYHEFGTQSLEYMLPDCFGFPHSLPSVLSHCGIRGCEGRSKRVAPGGAA